MALTYQAAVEQTITAGEQIHQIVNGTATTEVTVEDGSKVPSIRKALLDNFYFKDPIAWQVGQTESVFNQLRKFTDGSWWYAPSATASNPISMGATPVGNNNWKVYSLDAVVKLTPQLREALRRSYAEAGYNLVAGSFGAGGKLTTSTDVLLFEADGKAYSWGGTLSKTVDEGSTPSSSGGVGVSVWNDRSTAPNAFKQSGTGAVPRTVESKLGESVSVKDFGAKGDMSADDTAAAQSSLNTDKNVRLVSDVGYKITGQVTTQANGSIIGEGLSSALNFSGLPASVDAFKFSPPADGNAREYAGLSGVYILQSSGGRHAVLVDVSEAGQIISRFKVDSSYLLANGSGHYAFAVDNPTNTADRFFLGYFENSVFNGGLLLNGAGDSINATGCTFTGVNEAVALVQTTESSPGAAGPSSMFVFERNNSTANKGVYIIDAQSPKIRNNNLECGSGPGAGSEQALVNILGQTKRIFGAEVTGNAILHAPNCTTGVFVGNTDGALVENNVFGIAATGYAIVVSADSKNARIGFNTYQPAGTGREVQDLGVGTKGVFKSPSLQNSWTNAGGSLEVAKFIKGLDGFVRISGVIANGSVAGDTVLFTLPSGFRPSERCMFASYGYTAGGAYVTTVIRIDADGAVRLRQTSGGASVLIELGLCGIAFFAPDVP